MPFRLLAATPLGLTVTLALVFVMQTLIDTGMNPLSDRIAPKLPVWIAEPPTEVPPIADPPSLLHPNPAPPPPVNHTVADALPEAIGVHYAPKPPAGTKTPVLGFSPLANGALMQVTTAPPVYPASALERRIEGYVTVRFDVNVRGRTENVRVVDASHTVFEAAAVRAAKKLRFKPAVVDGQPQPALDMAYRFRFQLDD